MLPTNLLLNATTPAGPHLPTATLRQYAAGILAPAAQHRVEAHTLACSRCADILEGLLQTPASTTDQALAQLQQRLRRRGQQTGPAGLGAASRAWLSPRWLALQLAAAATLLFGLVAGGWWTWQQRHPAPAAVASAPATPPVATPAPLATTLAVAPTAAIAAPTRLPKRLACGPRSSQRAAAGRQASTSDPLAQGTALAAATQLAAVTGAPPATTSNLPAASYAPPAAATASAAGPLDSVAPTKPAADPALLARKTKTLAPKLVRANSMSSAPAIPPVPTGGYATWREKIRREAAEFRPAESEQPLSGSVQLRLLIGADGQIQQISVLHGLRADYDTEAQRLVCDGPNWVPGIGNDKRAAQAIDVAVPF